MMQRNEAEQYVEGLLDYALAHGREPGSWYRYHNHIYGVALLAEKIAIKLGNLEPERAYVIGLLHDAGKFQELTERRFHGICGYEMLRDSDAQAARIALTHTFFENILPAYSDVEETFFKKRIDYSYVAAYLAEHPVDEYDRLIQLCDCLANCKGLVTLEERREEYAQRHQRAVSIYVFEGSDKMKHYFDEKLGMDVYSFFSEISDDFMLQSGRDFK